MKNKIVIKNIKSKFYHKLINNEAIYDKSSINRYKKSYNLPDSIFFDSMNDLYNKRKIDAVTAFNSTYDHLKVVKFF